MFTIKLVASNRKFGHCTIRFTVINSVDHSPLSCVCVLNCANLDFRLFLAATLCFYYARILIVSEEDLREVDLGKDYDAFDHKFISKDHAAKLKSTVAHVLKFCRLPPFHVIIANLLTFFHHQRFLVVVPNDEE